MPFFKTENGNAENIKYDDTKSVKEVIDDIKDTAMFIDSFNTDTGTLNTTSESGSSSGSQTASSVTFDNTDTGLEAANVQDAIEEVNGKLQSETSYVPILSNYVYSSQTLALKIFGNAVQIKIPTLQNVVHGDNVICSVGAIPEKCRPSSDTSFTTIATNGGGNTRYICTIRPDGSIWIYNYGTYSGAENFSDTFVYLL